MQIIHFNNIKEQIKNISLTIGGFDGLHLAHMELIKRMIVEAQNNNLKSAILTFEPLIISALGIKKTYPIISLDEKIKKCEALNIDYFIIIDFNKAFQNKTKDEFIEELKAKLEVKKLIVGFDFSFGKDGLGKVSDLQNEFATIIINEIKKNDQKIGTKIIKDYLLQGDIEKANELLGYNFFLTFDKALNESYLLLKNKNYDCIINKIPAKFNPYHNSLKEKAIIEFIK